MMNYLGKNILALGGVIDPVVGIVIGIPAFLQGNVASLVLLAIAWGELK